MAGLFYSSKSKSFFTALQSPFNDMAEFGREACKAISEISEDLGIAQVKSVLSSPTSIFRDKETFDEHVLFISSPDLISEEIFSQKYINGDGGILTVEIYRSKNARWDENDYPELKTICYQIYQSGSSIVTRSLIDSAVTTNLLMKLPNQTGFMAFLGKAMAQGRLPQYDAFFFNIKNFKYVNTVLPFSSELDVLKCYAEILKKTLAPDEILAHLGSDNFCALIKKEHSDIFLDTIGNFIFTFVYEGEEYLFSFGATIGGAHLDEKSNPGQVMMAINSAYLIARQNHHTVEYFSPQLMMNVMRQKEILANFKYAINNNEFIIYYQPKVRVSDKKICGAEALVRWKKDGKIISPGEFIPIFEKDGSIRELDFYVLETVCKFIKNNIIGKLEPIRISTNFSRLHLKDVNFARKISDILDKYEIPHSFIEVELTESEDFSDYVIMEKVVDELRGIGVSTSIDDFGTGYSSLNMLKRTQLDLIKIDKSFIPEDSLNPATQKDFIMFKQIIDIAKSLGMETVAEGVETDLQYDYLKNVSCDIVQGYLFDKPLPEDIFLERLVKGCY